MRTALVLVAMALLVCRVAAAQCLEERPAGSAGMGLAGAGASSLRTPASIWLNPALLPLAASQVNVELALLSDTRRFASAEVVNQPSSEAHDLDGVHLAPGVALAHSLGVPWLWGGLGYRVARQIHSRYPLGLDAEGEPPPGRYLGTELTLEQHVVSLALGARWRRVALGASLELSHLRFHHRRSLWAGLPDDQHLLDPGLDMDAQLQVRNALSAGGVVGAWAGLASWLELGFAVRLPFTAGLDGSVMLTPGPRPPSGLQRLDAHAEAAHLDLRMPLELQGGITLGPRRWRVVVEADYQRWSAADRPVAGLGDATLVLTPAAGPAREQPLTELPLGIGLRDTFSIHAGVELAPWGDVLVLRTGYAYHRGASIARQPSPVLLDLDRHVWGLGLQARIRWLSVGAAFTHSFESNFAVDESRAVLEDPLDRSVSSPIGAGLYRSSRLQIVFDAEVRW